MRAQVKKWGNSASVRIPTAVMEAASLSIDQPVDVREENGRVVIEPLPTPRYDLNSLLSAMRPDTFPDPDEGEFGPPSGDEAW